MAEVEPVSSSAQLALLPWLLGWQPPGDRTAFGAGLHAGSCLGIAWALRADLRHLGAREGATLLAVSLPAAAAGALAGDVVERRLGQPPQLAALLAGAGALMWWVDARAARRDRGAPATVPSSGHPVLPPAASVPAPPSAPLSAPVSAPLSATLPVTRDSCRGWRTASVHRKQAAAAALAQPLALIPGVSRSGATLTALRATGVDRASARRFSLLMSLPITAGAAAMSLARADRAALRVLGPALATGTLAAAVTGAAAATAARRRPGRGLAGAALYRLGLAAVVTRRLIREGAP